MLLVDRIRQNGLEVYFRYEYLDIDTVLKLFTQLTQLHGAILKATSPVYFNQETQERFRNILDISELKTGQSIRARFSEKWKIELPFGLGKVEGPFPKKLGTPLIITFFILWAISKGYSIHNSQLDSRLKELDIELKENELFRQMEERDIDRSEFNSAKRQGIKFVNYILKNPEIKYFELNGIPLKDE